MPCHDYIKSKIIERLFSIQKDERKTDYQWKESLLLEFYYLNRLHKKKLYYFNRLDQNIKNFKVLPLNISFSEALLKKLNEFIL